MHNNQSIVSKHAVITGAGGGIGSAIAQQLASEGVKVSLMGRNLAKLVAVADTLDEAHCIVADVTSETAVNRAMDDARDTFGAIDIVINNAGIAKSYPYLKQTTEDWREIMAVNLDGVHFCTHAALPDMLAQGWGRVINIASVAAQTGAAYVAAYVAAKHGVLGLTRSLALEFATKNITVNAVCPGYTDTEIVSTAIANIMAKTGRSKEEALHELVKNNPQQRLIQPEEIAHTVSWLCQPASAGITGQAISVAGGEVM